MLDFFDVSEYLAQASHSIAGTQAKGWLKEKQALLKENQSEEVIAELFKWREAETVAEEFAPVRKSYRYLSARREYLGYKRAIEAGLPIGSGEI